jgi:transposase-like protein
MECPYCQSEKLIKNGSVFGIPKWKCKECGRQTSLKPPRGQPMWKKEASILLYTMGLSMNAIAKVMGVSAPAVLGWIRSHADQKPRRQPRRVEGLGFIDLDMLWNFIQENKSTSGSGWLSITIENASSIGNAGVVLWSA